MRNAVQKKTPLVVVTMADLCDPPEVINDLVAAAEDEKAIRFLMITGVTKLTKSP